MKDFLAIVGVVLLICCGLLSLATVHVGGVRHVDEAGRTTEVLTWQGWQPADAPPEPAAPTPAPVVVVVQTTQLPAPPVTPLPAAPLRPSPLPLVADAGGRTGNDGGAAAYDGVAGVVAGSASPIAAPGTTPFWPWEMLGWTLAGLVPAGGMSALALFVYRQVALTRAQAAALRAVRPGAPTATSASPAPPGPPAPAAEALPADATEEGPEIDVAVFLRAVTAPPATAAGGG